MKSDKVMRLPAGSYRVHRFPPLAKPIAKPEAHSRSESDWQENQVELQQRLEDGFQKGLQQGHAEGLRQGTEQGKQQGLAEGHREGYQKGYVSGESAGKQLFQEAVRPVNELFTAFSHWQEERELQQRHTICELVQKVAQQVIRAELTLMPQQILALVDETLDAMPGRSQQVTVHLNPQDLDRIKQVSSDLPQAWKLVASDDLPAGGCYLVTEDAEADASCDSRLEACMDNVRAHLLDEGSQGEEVQSEPEQSAAEAAEITDGSDSADETGMVANTNNQPPKVPADEAPYVASPNSAENESASDGDASVTETFHE